MLLFYEQDPLEGTDLCGSGVADSWKSCAICLEEMADSDLMVHTACGGTLCQSCLEVREAKAVVIIAILLTIALPGSLVKCLHMCCHVVDSFSI